MSGIIKGIKKAFRKVVTVAKKIALPALAIGAVVLTGGAALGALPALGGAGGMLASLGLGPALTGVLSTAATGATIGAGGALLTGGNIVKGATRGFIGGAVTGGIGAAMAPAASAASAAGGAAGTAGAGATVAPLAQAGQSVSALRTAAGIGSAASGMPASLAAPALSSALPAGITAAAPAAAGAVASSAGGPLSRIFNVMERNPMLTAGVVQGIGSGLTAASQAKEARRQQEMEQASYDGVGDALYSYGGGAGGGQDPNSRFNAPVYGRVTYDRATGRIVPVGG